MYDRGLSISRQLLRKAASYGQATATGSRQLEDVWTADLEPYAWRGNWPKKALAGKPLDFDMVVCPPAPLVWPEVAEAVMGTPVMMGGQDCHTATHGAFTGDVSAAMFADLGCRYVIADGIPSARLGKITASPTNSSAHKVAAMQLAGLTAILCIGETAGDSRRRYHRRGDRKASCAPRCRRSAPRRIWLLPMSRSGPSAAASSLRPRKSPKFTTSSVKCLAPPRQSGAGVIWRLGHAA